MPGLFQPDTWSAPLQRGMTWLRRRPCAQSQGGTPATITGPAAELQRGHFERGDMMLRILILNIRMEAVRLRPSPSRALRSPVGRRLETAHLPSLPPPPSPTSGPASNFSETASPRPTLP